MARADGSDVSTLPRSGHGGALLSVLLHLAVAGMLLGGTLPRDAIEPPALLVELVALEAPPPPAAPPVEIQSPPPRPVVRQPQAPPRPAPAARPAVGAGAAAEDSPVAPSPVAAASPAAPVPAVAEDSPPPLPAAATATADYGAYVGRLHDSIARHRIYPPQSARRREEGDVRLRVLLATDGRLLDILTLAEASSQLTQAARQAVESAAPFAPPPLAAAGDRQVAFDVTVAFRLR